MIYIPNNRAVNEAKGVKTMTTEQIHNALKDDPAYHCAVDNFDLINMGIVLRAHGFSHTVEDICRIFEFLGITAETSK